MSSNPEAADSRIQAVFLSYARSDREVVVAIAQLLRGTAAAVFRDEDSIRPGTKWHLAIADAIEGCTALFVFWSAAAATSKSVEAEYRSAIGLQKSIVPVLLDDTPLAAELAEYQWVDLRSIILSAKSRPEDIVVKRVGPAVAPVASLLILLVQMLSRADSSKHRSVVSQRHLEFDLSEQEAILRAFVISTRTIN